ncbi:MAG: non-canonical purine NTP pyrophosphatase [Thermoguttaceae bacterium]
MSTKLFVLGTNNRKKGFELQEMLSPLGIEIKTLADFDVKIDVVEDGTTFSANARKKAIETAKLLGEWVIAEDSGISVDLLDGAPGVFSARFSGPGATDESNNCLLLEKLGDAPLEKRTARYTCCCVVANPNGELHAETEAYCKGRIRFEPCGSGGFGYDPLFEVVEYHKTFGEMDPTLKKYISHRSRAIRLLVPKL